MIDNQRFLLSGMGVALITPFLPDFSIDFDALARLIDLQIEAASDFIVVLGTTAETPTLNDDERKKIKDFVRRRVDGRIPLVLGLGGNDTRRLTEIFRTEDTEGFSAILSAVPFYNKPSQEGIYRHYAALAEVSSLPLILYNVPGRTGVNMKAATTLRLAKDFDNIIGVKEASGNESQADEIMRNAPDGFSLISGDDAMTFPLMELGATGVISVVGNAFPAEFGRMVHLCAEGDNAGALEIHRRFSELLRLLFADGNPAGVKRVLYDKGLIHNVLRLPLTEVSRQVADALKIELSKL